MIVELRGWLGKPEGRDCGRCSGTKLAGENGSRIKLTILGI
jgi:hypothetical protein